MPRPTPRAGASRERQDFDPTGSVRVPCIQLNANEVTVGVPTSRLLQWVPDYLAEPNLFGSDPETLAFINMRAQVQRAFIARKRANVPSYQQYIEQRVTGERFGSTPEVTIFTSHRLEVVEVAASGFQLKLVVVPSDLPFVAIDGETQRVARQRATLNRPEAANDVVAVRILHGITLEQAGQIFHDRNALGVSGTISDSIAKDTSDPATRLANRIADDPSCFINGRVSRHGKSLTKDDAENVVMISALRTAVVTTICGRGGLQIGSKSIAMRPAAQHVDDVADRVHVLWQTFFNQFRKELEFPRRLDTILSAPSVLGAIGVVFNRTLPPPFNELAQISQAEAMALLGTVRWNRTYTDANGQLRSQWEGIALKSRNGSFSLGGPNEYGRSISDALLDPESPAGRLIRLDESVLPRMSRHAVTGRSAGQSDLFSAI